MEVIYEFLRGFDLQNIISIFAIVWILSSHKLKKISEDLKEIKTLLSFIDRRLTRLEGPFDEHGYWESRNKKIGDE